MNPLNEKYNDVVELCALLQCLGFSVKSLDASDGNLSQDGGVRTVVVNCQSSGLHVVLESGTAFCSCPEINQQNSGCWQVSGVSGGKPFDKEFQTTLLSSVPKAVRDRVSLELNNIMQTIRQNMVTEFDSSKDKEVFHKSASMVDLESPTKRLNLKVDTPTRYRSLDTLAAIKEKDGFMSIRQLGLEKKMCNRQSTYTLSSTPESAMPSNKTSSPINVHRTTAIESLLEAEKAAEELRIKLRKVIKQLSEECKESSVSSLALDVSKISISKTSELSKAQYVSSPNLSATMNLSQDPKKKTLKVGESLSTSNLAKSSASKQGSATSKLPRISPNIFRKMKDSLTINPDKEKTSENKPSKLNSLFKNKSSTQTPKRTSIEAGPSPSMSKKRFSHIKTTIPKPTPKK